jgi:MoxR-like ATPase
VSAASLAATLRASIAQSWRGSDHTLDLVIAAVFAGGHVLLEDVPGVGKTTLASSLARAIGGRFMRVQGTADLLPGDLTGMVVLVPGQVEPAFHPGPLFANVVLADEVNRAPPRTQSALLEAMAEGSVTVDGVTRQLPQPFLVIATQNPHDHHGTYALPESQLDRFLIRLSLGYPTRDDERAILRASPKRASTAESVTDASHVLDAAREVDAVRVADAIEDWMLSVAAASRVHPRLLRGVSPRGTAAWHRAARALALVRGRAFVIPEDVRDLGVVVLGHRVVTRASEDGADVIAALLREHASPG